MNRRSFMAKVAVGAAALSISAGPTKVRAESKTGERRKFNLNYAPHFGMFQYNAGPSPIDQLKFMADEGFGALEDNGMMNRPEEEQKKISMEMSRLNITMGVFVTGFGIEDKTFVSKAKRDMLVNGMKSAVETAKRVNARWCTVILGQSDNRIEWDYQTATVIENLKYCAEVCEPAGLIMVLEPLNPRDHPGCFLTKIAQAYQICRAVGSPSCKILDDFYHQQITEGNLIANMQMAWDEIAYFQAGDNPGRKEPTTGEVNYKNIFKHLYKRGYKGIVGMEHGNSRPGKEGERAVIEAYRFCDDF